MKLAVLFLLVAISTMWGCKNSHEKLLGNDGTPAQAMRIEVRTRTVLTPPAGQTINGTSAFVLKPHQIAYLYRHEDRWEVVLKEKKP